MQKAACCFISLSILEGLDAHSLVKEFIILRSNMLQHTLTEGSSADTNIENSSNLIINTIYNLYLCFTSKIILIYNILFVYFFDSSIIQMFKCYLDYDLYNSGIIYLKINNILRNGRSVLSQVELDYSLKFGLMYLPNSVKEFKYVI